MAEIWLYSGDGPIDEEELDERPFKECVELLELTADHYLGEDPTRVPPKGEALPTSDGYLVVAVSEAEASGLGWQAGYYPSPLAAAAALDRLGFDPSQILNA